MIAALLLSSIATAGSFEPAWLGPRFSLGLAFSGLGGTKAEGLQPAPWAGVGARVGAGVSMGLTEEWGLIGEVGYHSLYGKPSGGGDAVRASALHLGYGWLAAEWNRDRYRLAVGPKWSVGGGRATAACEGCEGQRLKGSVMAGGLTGSFTVEVMQRGSFSGALGIVSGALSDAVRWYPWGEVALLVTPALPRRN